MMKRKHTHDKEESGSDGEPESDADNLDLSVEGGCHIEGIYIPPPPKVYCTLNTTGPRLIITKIVNNFFKSYAGEQPLGPFHKCFNAIIGPNGSGKSNVIDSMLFVFGYRANKIRTKNISVLIHNSKEYRNVRGCSVAVHFARIIDKEGDNYDVVPGSEFVIARNVHKDGSSYYQLNGHKVQFKEIALILRTHGVDLDHNRFLILQGEVEQIAMMKCKGQNEHETGMLEYLEDIIGTTQYKVPLRLLHQKIEQLADDWSEKLNRVKLVENEMEELKGPMDEAVQFLKLENKIIVNKNILWQKKIHDVEDKLEEIEKGNANIITEQQKLSDKLSTIQSEKKVKDKILREKSKKYEDLQKKKEIFKSAFDKANNNDVRLQAEMVQINQTRKKTIDLLNNEKKLLVEYEEIPQKNEQNIVDCTKREENLTSDKRKLEEEKTRLLDNLRHETQDLQERKNVLETQLNELKKTVEGPKDQFNLAENELTLYVSNEKNEQQKLEVLRTTHENNETTITTRKEAIPQLRTKIPPTEKSLQNAIAELNEVKRAEATISDNLKKKRAMLEENRASMQASRSRGRVLDALLQQKREGHCPGLFGRLGDLGAIDKKYDVAVSTACGPLDNIVVDTVETAKWCINFLKQHDIGRATFIALDQQVHLEDYANTTINTPEAVPRLYDLIHIQDNRVRTAFYYALRDTLVANEIDQATRIAYGAKRYRVVTSGGDLIEMTGTMSGGGKTVSRGRMGQSVAVLNVSVTDLQVMETDLNALEQEKYELHKKQNYLENQISVFQTELQEMKIDLNKFTTELKYLEQQKAQLHQQLKEQETVCKNTIADPTVVKKLTDTMTKKKLVYDKAMEAANEVQVQVDEITKEIKEKTSDKMQTIGKKISDVTKIIEKCKAETRRLKIAIKTAERNSEKSREKMTAMQQDITDAENKLKNMKAQRDEIDADGRKLLTCIEEVDTQLLQEEDGYSEIKEEVAALTKKENDVKAEKIEVDERLKLVEATINNNKAQIHEWRAKVLNLKLQDVPNQTMETLKTYTPEELMRRDIQSVQRDIQLQEEELKSMTPNLAAIQNYCKQQTVYIARSKELTNISTQKAKVTESFESLRNRRKEEFLVGYNIIKLKLKEMYQMITLGGDADFGIVDSFDPFAEGIQFNVRPPKKSWKNICNLSGGEKTLSSLALVFALHYYKPSPLYVMDEIDAALDFKNVSIIGNYIKERTKNAQFIIISLRSNMFEICDYTVGIYKVLDCTKSVTIDPRVYDDKNEQTSREVLQQIDNVLNANEEVMPCIKQGDKENLVNEQITEEDPISPTVDNEVINMDVD